ncbi:hypothetical protein [Aeromicrobium wangtongii]|uniref:Uncharacterized protein n=1 Tax=Aeromicrobium wangtongii TaxID=2969247 RepID=A0ABY5MEL0_9ACTN|nr:hypothetical protein [Aeromicrobium wangtongii]MCD9197982.1 hypothetical protein [Aeromicrobium wangtongii]UUP15460.1 hypothetical protein NQV15_09135 [Aeromicrobium wangtongii]
MCVLCGYPRTRAGNPPSPGARGNFRALAAAFDARRSDVVEPDLALIDLGDAVESATTRRALRSLARANQMVAIIATDAVSEPDESLDDVTRPESRTAGS